MKVPINKDSPLAMDDFDAAVQQRMERLQSYIDLIRTAEAVEEEVKPRVQNCILVRKMWRHT